MKSNEKKQMCKLVGNVELYRLMLEELHHAMNCLCVANLNADSDDCISEQNFVDFDTKLEKLNRCFQSIHNMMICRAFTLVPLPDVVPQSDVDSE